MDVILATDCGSTTTKAILIERRPEGYRQTFRGEAPTTVEAPFEDVTRGVLNAVQELQELSGRRLIRDGRILAPAGAQEGVDVYVSTSSAGGGLQMLVMGVVAKMTAESAQRAALGAGAIVMDVVATNDGRLPHEKIERIRQLRPDMILLSGGTDGGTVTHVVELAEYVAAARPRPRLGHGFQLPVIYAGNVDAREHVEGTLAGQFALSVTDNLRPALEREHLQPARLKIQDLFLEHVMAQAPGYDALLGWVGAPIMPTPGAVGEIMQRIARRESMNLVGVDIGGATTDVFSVFETVFNRTVSANLGMSYSVSNVLAEAGLPAILRWVPLEIEREDLQNRIKNKMIRPTTIPQTLDELKVEHAIAREALRLAFIQHKQLAVGLSGVQRERDISEAFTGAAADSIVKMGALDMIVGSGGVLSHAPRRSQAMLMMMDAFQPEGVTELAVDSIFMMPHLGVLAQVNEEAAVEVFERDCLIRLGTCIAAAGRRKWGARCLDYRIEAADGRTAEGTLECGALMRFELGAGETARVEITPARGVDVGAGRGHALESEVSGGVVGLVLDARGRPLELPAEPDERLGALERWGGELEAYPGS
jgi:uncharacterized protein (TIGR01319 family)